MGAASVTEAWEHVLRRDLANRFICMCAALGKRLCQTVRARGPLNLPGGVHCADEETKKKRNVMTSLKPQSQGVRSKTESRIGAKRGVMGFQKFSPFLALSILVLLQAGSLHAAPFRSALESSPDPATLSEEEARLLLAALVQDYVQMKASELEQEQEQEQETEGSSLDSPRSKRCGNLSTCMLGTYTQDFNKFHTFPQTAIGVGAPGKKRDMSSDLERDHRPYVSMPQDAN
ncbi:hypothetical protein H8959_002547 [Pygathrix nigripes]